jgi:hypothetical protein
VRFRISWLIFVGGHRDARDVSRQILASVKRRAPSELGHEPDMNASLRNKPLMLISESMPSRCKMGVMGRMRDHAPLRRVAACGFRHATPTPVFTSV